MSSSKGFGSGYMSGNILTTLSTGTLERIAVLMDNGISCQAYNPADSDKNFKYRIVLMKKMG